MAQQSTGKQNKTNQASSQGQTKSVKKGTPLIVERVNKFPLVNMAISMSYSQYDRLKSSNITVGDVMTRAESWAVYVWEKVQPIVEKLQEPINRADQLACQTLDFVEGKLCQVKMPQSPFIETLLTKYNQVAAPVIKNITSKAITGEQKQHQQQAAAVST